MIDWIVTTEYEMFEGWKYEATADIEGFHITVYGSYDEANTMGRPVDVDVQGENAQLLAASPKHGVTAEDIPGLANALMAEPQYPEEGSRESA